LFHTLTPLTFQVVYITLTGSGKLAVMDWPQPGLKLHFNR